MTPTRREGLRNGDESILTRFTKSKSETMVSIAVKMLIGPLWHTPSMSAWITLAFLSIGFLVTA